MTLLLGIYTFVSAYRDTSPNTRDSWMSAVNQTLQGSSFVNTFLRSVVFFLLHRDPSTDFYRIKDRHDLVSGGWITRLKWAAALSVTARGIGWNFQVPKCPPLRGPRTRAAFVRKRIITITQKLLVFVSVCYGIIIPFHINVYHLATTPPSASNLGLHWGDTIILPLHPVLFLKRALASWTYIMATRIGLSAAYEIAALVGVALGLTDPEEWPDAFGSAKDAYTVRKCWGCVKFE
jgi:hypothetical protein